MKNNFIQAFLLTVGLLLILCIGYPLLIWGSAQLSYNQGNGFVLKKSNNCYYENIGQQFTMDKYLWSRPSDSEFKTFLSGGSHKGWSNISYLKMVEDRLVVFLKKNPSVKREEVPIDMITASGSGIDPDISLQAARVQITRIAKARGIDESLVAEVIESQTEKAFLGIFGPAKVNVLKVNLALNVLNNCKQ